jgi:hypothetical protein
LSNLFLVVIFDGVLVTLFKFGESDSNLSCPPNLGATEGNLGANTINLRGIFRKELSFIQIANLNTNRLV